MSPNRYVDPNRLPCSAIILVMGAYLLALFRLTLLEPRVRSTVDDHLRSSIALDDALAILPWRHPRRARVR